MATKTTNRAMLAMKITRIIDLCGHGDHNHCQSYSGLNLQHIATKTTNTNRAMLAMKITIILYTKVKINSLVNITMKLP